METPPNPPRADPPQRRKSLSILSQYVALSVAAIATIILLERGASLALSYLKLQSKSFDLPTLISLASGGAVAVRWVWGKFQRMIASVEELRQRVASLETANKNEISDDSEQRKRLEDVSEKLKYLEIRVDYNDTRLTMQERGNNFERRRGE